MEQLVLNSAKCLNCEDVLVSKTRHDFQSCVCFNISQKWIEEFLGKKFKKNGHYTKSYKRHLNNNNFGITIDGGLDYLRIGGNLAHYLGLNKYKNVRVVKNEKRKEIKTNNRRKKSNSKK